MNNNSSNKYLIFIAPVILLLVFIAGVIFVLNPAIKNIKDKSNSIQEKLVELDIEKDKINELPVLKEQFTKVDMHKDELDVLFHEKDIVVLVQNIEKMAEETGNSIAISVDENGGGVLKAKTRIDKDSNEEDKLLEDFSEEEFFKIDIDVVGNYPGLLNFLDRFNNLGYYNSLVSFKIVSHEEEYKEESRLINIEPGRANANPGSDLTEIDSNLILESELGMVFYLNKIVNKSSDNNGS